MPAFGDLAPRYIKGKTKLTGDLRGPTGLDFRARGGATATEIVGTYNTPRGQYINAPLLVPGQRDVKRLLKGKKATHSQVVRGIKYAKKQGASRYNSIPEAEAVEQERHKRLEKEF